MDETDKKIKELEAELESYIKKEMEDLLESKTLSKKYVLKELFKSSMKWISGKLPIDLYEIFEERKKQYEEKMQKIVNTIYLKNIEKMQRKIDKKTGRIYKKTKKIDKKTDEILERVKKIPIKGEGEQYSVSKSKPLIFIPHPYPEAPNFTGRVAEKQMLTDWLLHDPEHPLLSMVAIGGMGKSALAWRWLQEEVLGKDNQLDGVVWWSFYESKADFRAFLNELGDGVFKEDREHYKSLAEREKLDYTFNYFSNNNYLLIFDGFERTLRAYMGISACYIGDDCKLEDRERHRQCVDSNLAWFLRALTAINCNSKTLLTTRLHPLDLESFLGVKKVVLEKMNPMDAVDFFQAQGVNGTRAEIETACEKYNFLPLCLRLLSGMIITHPKYRKDKDIKLAENIPDLDLTKVDDNLQDAIKFQHILQYSYDELMPENQQLMSNIAAFRSPMEFTTLREILAQDINVNEFREKLECFKKRGLLQFNERTDSYDLHPVVGRYCYARLIEPKKIHGIITKYLEEKVNKQFGLRIPFKYQILMDPGPMKIEKIEDLQPVIELYYHSIGSEKYEEAFLILYDRLQSPLYYGFGAFHEFSELLLAFFVDGIDNPPDLCDEYVSWILNSLANSFSHSGQPQKALPVFKQAIRIAEIVRKWGDVAIGLGNLAKMAQVPIGNLESAESNLQKRIVIAGKNNDEISVAMANLELGRISAYLGRFDESIKKISKAQVVLDSYGPLKTNSVSLIRAYKSNYALLMNNPRDGLRFAQEALVHAKEWEKEFAKQNILQAGVANLIQCNLLIGASYIAMKDAAKVEAPLQFAITKCRKINMVDYEAPILLELAKLRHLQQKDDESLNLATEALEIANRCGYILQQADIEQFLGEYYKDQGDMKKARKYFEDCIEHCTHCWKYNEKTKDFDYVKKDEKWWYKPRYEMAVRLLEELQ